MKDIYVYIDESMNPNPDSFDGSNIEERYFLLGMLITEIPFPNEPISNALKSLSNDPDVKIPKEEEQDALTLKRKYFHASFDSKNAHSWLCREINDVKFPLEFHVIYWDKTLKGADDLKTEKDVHKHLLNQLLAEFSFTHDIRINVFVAQRTSFAQRQASEIINEIKEAYIYSASQYYYKPTIYNNFMINIVEGDNTGVQICDFILWTFKRKILDGNSVWHSRLSDSRWIKFEQKPANGFPFGKESFDANGGLNLPFVKSENLFGEFIKSEKWDPEEVKQALQWVEFKIREKYLNIKENEDYLRNDLKELVEATSINITDNPQKDIEVVDILAKTTLLIVDTLPLQDLSNPQEMKLSQIAKGYAAFVMNYSDMRWIACRNYWCDIRENYFTAGSENLIKLPL